MGKPVTGDVVVLLFSQTNLQTGKRRPALVLADLPGDDLIHCQITSQAHFDRHSVSLAATDFERGRLAVNSLYPPEPALHRRAIRHPLRRRKNQ